MVACEEIQSKMARIEAFCVTTLFCVNLWMFVWCIYGTVRCGGNRDSFFKDNAEIERKFDAEIERFEYAQINEEKDLLTESPSPTVPLSSAFSVKHRTRRLILGIVLGSMTGFAAAAVVATLMRAAVIYINRAPLLKGTVVFDPRIGSKMLSFLEQDGCLDEADLVGVGANGRVYRANLENGMTVAVKKISRMEPHEAGNNASVKRLIQEEVEVLGRVRHENLVALQAYVHHPNAHLLVYDYVPNGSLDDALKKIRDNQLHLSWSVRHRIAVGTITGLEYLHFRCNPRIVHRDLKPANILLDDEFEPHLSDFGLAKLMPNSGTVGYIAPECYQSCRYTDKSDVFSFGVVLAVLLTGKEPTDGLFNEAPGGSIGRWLRHLQQTGKAFEALDPGILEEEKEEEEEEEAGRQEEEMLMAVRIAAACLSEMPGDRPTSEELVSMLTQLHSF